MRYTVEIQGETFLVDVRTNSTGIEVAVGDGSYRHARLRPAPAPLSTLEVGNDRHRVVVTPDAFLPGAFDVGVEGQRPVRVTAADARSLAAATGRKGDAKRGMKLIRAAMPGVILEVRISTGDQVTAGQVLLVLEAMKMQNEISATADAVVKTVHVEAGTSVAAGAKLVEFSE